MMYIAVLCAATLALSAGVAAQEIVSRSHPTPLNFMSGETIQLTCGFDSATHRFDRWNHPSFGDITTSTTNPRFDVGILLRETDSEVDFFITNTMSADNGTYRCEFTQMATSASDYDVIHAFYQQSITFSISDNERHNPSSGDTVTLLCGAQHHTEIQWYGPDQQPVDEGGRFRVVGGNLIIDDVFPSDNGTYRCFASNPRFSNSLYSHVFVNTELPLSISATPEMVAVDLSSRVVFTCSARSYPVDSNDPPTWFSEDTETGVLSPVAESRLGALRLVNEITVEQDLVLDPVGLGDVGTYTCTTLGAGTASDSVTLEVIGTLSPPQNVAATLAEDTVVVVTWEPPLLDDPTNEIISYKVTWIAVNGSRPHTTSFSLPDGSARSYMITGLDHGTHYTIVVHASNNTGRGRDSTPVAITTNPTFPDAPTEVVMNEINSSFVELVVTLGGGDGGAPVTLVRVGYQPVSGEGVRTEVDTSLEPGVKNVTVSIEGLTPQTRYLLRASAMNWRGFSPPYEGGEVVTLAAPLLLPPQTPGSVPLIGVGVGVVGGVGVCVLIIVAVVALCFFARRRRRRSQKKTINYASSSSSGSLPADDLRRGSSRSNKALMEYDAEQQQRAVYLKQTSTGSSTLSSQGSFEEPSPSTVMSSLNSTYVQPPLTTIPEHSYPPPHSSTPSQHIQYNANQQHDLEITVNPLNQSYEDEKRAEMGQNYGDTEDVLMPPGGMPTHDSFSEDGLSSNPIYGHAPYLGESYSQACSPSFPQMQSSSSISKLPATNRYVESEASFNTQGEEPAGRQALEYTDNEAYETFTPPLVRREAKAPPRFAITGGGGGGVRERVEIRL